MPYPIAGKKTRQSRWTVFILVWPGAPQVHADRLDRPQSHRTPPGAHWAAPCPGTASSLPRPGGVARLRGCSSSLSLTQQLFGFRVGHHNLCQRDCEPQSGSEAELRQPCGRCPSSRDGHGQRVAEDPRAAPLEAPAGQAAGHQGPSACRGLVFSMTVGNPNGCSL